MNLALSVSCLYPTCLCSTEAATTRRPKFSQTKLSQCFAPHNLIAHCLFETVESKDKTSLRQHSSSDKMREAHGKGQKDGDTEKRAEREDEKGQEV